MSRASKDALSAFDIRRIMAMLELRMTRAVDFGEFKKPPVTDFPYCVHIEEDSDDGYYDSLWMNKPTWRDDLFPGCIWPYIELRDSVVEWLGSHTPEHQVWRGDDAGEVWFIFRRKLDAELFK